MQTTLPPFSLTRRGLYIVNKIKCIYWFNYKVVIFSQRKEVILNFNLTQINSCCINYSQYIQNKIENKLRMKAINYACFKLEEKPTRSVKKKKNNFINVIGDKFTMSTRWRKFENFTLWRPNKTVNPLTYIMEVTLMLISFES